MNTEQLRELAYYIENIDAGEAVCTREDAALLLNAANQIERLRQKRMAQSHEIAVLRSRLAQLESETDDLRRDLPA